MTYVTINWYHQYSGNWSHMAFWFNIIILSQINTWFRTHEYDLSTWLYFVRSKQIIYANHTCAHLILCNILHYNIHTSVQSLYWNCNEASLGKNLSWKHRYVVSFKYNLCKLKFNSFSLATHLSNWIQSHTYPQDRQSIIMCTAYNSYVYSFTKILYDQWV